MLRFPRSLLHPAVIFPAVTAVIAATIWLALPDSSPGTAAPVTKTVPAAPFNSQAAGPAISQVVESGGPDEWAAYMDKASRLMDTMTTPADRQYYHTSAAAACRATRMDRKNQQAQAGQTMVSPEMQAAWAEEEKLCANVPELTEAQVLEQMEQASQAGQKDARLYLLQHRADAAGLTGMQAGAKPSGDLTPQELQQREQLVASVQAPANTGHRESLQLLSEIGMASANESQDYATPLALSLVSTLDWSKPLPTSLSDESLSYVPEEWRGEVLRRAGEIYRECCVNAPNKKAYASALDELGPAPVALQEQAVGSLVDIFRIKKN